MVVFTSDDLSILFRAQSNEKFSFCLCKGILKCLPLETAHF